MRLDAFGVLLVSPLLLCVGLCSENATTALSPEERSKRLEALNAFLSQAGGTQYDYRNTVNSRRSRTEWTAGQWRHKIEKLLHVQCTPDTMRVDLHYDTVHSQLSEQQTEVFARSRIRARNPLDGESCTELAASVRLESERVVRLDIPLNGCLSSQVDVGNGTLTYVSKIEVNVTKLSAMIASQDSTLASEVYPVQCTYRPETMPRPTPVLNLYDEKYSLNAWEYPRRVSVGSHLFLQGSHSSANAVNPNDFAAPYLHSFPVNCWTSPFPADSEPKKFFIEQGCPKTDEKGRGLATATYFLDNRPVRVGFHLGNYSLFKNVDHVFIHCQLILCVKSTLIGIHGFPKCPSSHFCAHQTANSHYLPDPQLQAEFRTNSVHSSSGQLIMIAQEDIVEAMLATNAQKTQQNVEHCQRQCAADATRAALLAVQQRQSSQEPVVVQGVSTTLVICVAFASFIFGTLVMAGLWYIHVHTDPAKKPRLSELLLDTRSGETGSSYLQDPRPRVDRWLLANRPNRCSTPQRSAQSLHHTEPT